MIALFVQHTINLKGLMMVDESRLDQLFKLILVKVIIRVEILTIYRFDLSFH